MDSPEGANVDFDLKQRAMDEAPVGIAITDLGREDNPLVYVNDAFERMTGYDRAEVLGRNCRFLQGEETDPDAVRRLREAVAAERPATVELLNYRADGEQFWNEVTIAPVRDEDGEVTNFVGFQNDVTARKEAELAVERERESLTHLVNRINGLLQDVTEVLMRADSRQDGERAVCERIVAHDPYVSAWFAEPDRVDDVLVPSSGVGADAPAEGTEVDVEGDHLVARAYRTRSVQIDDPGAAADAHARPTTAAPLAYGDRVYGVLAVVADASEGFADRERVVIEALGRTIATAIDAAESRRVLRADDVVELEFEVRDRALVFADLAAACNCRLEYEGSVSRADGALSSFFTTDAAPEEVLEYAADAPAMESATLVRGDATESLFEFAFASGSIVADLAEWGAKLRSLTATEGVATIVMEVPAEAQPRVMADRLRERYPDATLVAYRERERPPTTAGEFVSELEARLTDRQLLALQRAYLGGYYERSRSTTGDELAESMDISRSTFHQHLRTAEQKVLGEFFRNRT